MRLCDVHQGRVAGIILDAVDDGGLVGGGQVRAAALGAEGFADIFEQLGQVDVLGVDFVYNDEPGDVGLSGKFEEFSGVGFYAGGGGDDDKGGLGCGDGLDCRAEKVRIAGGIDDVYCGAGVGGVDDSRGDGMLAGLFLVVVVAG